MSEHVYTYAQYCREALTREGFEVVLVMQNPFDKDFPFGLVAVVKAPWEQYDRNSKPGTWMRSITRSETVHDFMAAYKKAYS